MEPIPRRSFLKASALTGGLLSLAASGFPISAAAASQYRESGSSQNSLDQFISKEPLQIGSLEFYNGANIQLAASMLNIDKELKLNTHTQWDADTITPPDFEASVLRSIKGAGVIFLHSSYLLGNDGNPVELPGEPFRALVEGTRRKGFLGDLQFNYRKVKLLEEYPIFTLSVNGKSEQFYVQRINFYNTRDMTSPLVDDLLNSGDNTTLKISTCGLSAHTAVDQCATTLSEKQFTNNPTIQQAVKVLTNPLSTSEELKDAVLNTCSDYMPDANGIIVATYMGAKEIIVEEKINGVIRRKKVYHNIPITDLEKIGIDYYTDRRIVWTLKKLPSK